MIFFFKQKTAYEMRISDWSSDVCSSDLDPTLRDSFAIGEQGGSLCEVQATVNDRVIEGMFDRAWTIICRDASQPVGTVRMLRADADTPRARIERARAGPIRSARDGERTVGDRAVSWRISAVRLGGQGGLSRVK